MAKSGRKRKSSALRLSSPDVKRTKYDEATDIIRGFESFAASPEQFADQSEALQSEILRVLQQTYQCGSLFYMIYKITLANWNVAKNLEPKKLSPLTKLIVRDLDSDQIWEQIQLFNKPLLKYVNGLSLEDLLSSDSEEESSGVDQLDDPQMFELPCFAFRK